MQFEVAQVTGAPENVKTVSSLDAAQRVIVAEGYEGGQAIAETNFFDN
jgi:hypothetical protein